MRKNRYIALSGASLLVALILLYYGINYQGVMMSIVGGTLLFQSLAIIATPLSENNNLEKFYEKVIVGYASNLEKILSSTTSSQAFYISFEDKVGIMITGESSHEIRILLDAMGGDLAEEIEKSLNLSNGLKIEEILSKLNRVLQKKKLAKKFEYNITDESIIFKIRKPITLKLHRYLNRTAPKTYSYLGCPLSSAIAVLATKILKKNLMVNFKLENDTAVIMLKPIDLNFTRVVQDEERILA